MQTDHLPTIQPTAAKTLVNTKKTKYRVRSASFVSVSISGQKLLDLSVFVINEIRYQTYNCKFKLSEFCCGWAVEFYEIYNLEI